ncbi:pimeloyl-ACP methyl ester carboxylesterase [Sphingobium sp. OAS761]|uniref:alpha/beta fold hydrolase n=1 Tax=Sphingobium sp. OAS761 TaxID=2817901 RepID=UPI00209D2F75|nr:alpha/beta hydrolase [Sphingobium sp. OAS761]MCP1470336.1 pimeloyl-ACP methyl ester carboxylesterase [Sphingobium sp. OAS761]
MTESLIDVGGYRLRAVERGDGPLVLMIHGFPGLAWSWRHQMAPLAQAGYRAVAIDSLGYGGSDRPSDPSAYTSDRMQTYLIALIDHYGADRAIVVGQDFGAQYAWNMAVRAPHRVAALITTIPYDYDMAGRAMLGVAPRLPVDAPARPVASSPDRLPSERFAAMARDQFVHFHYFQSAGPAERELGARPADFLHRLFHTLSADGDMWAWKAGSSDGSGYLDVLPDAPPLPWPWLSEAAFEHFAMGYDHPDPMLRFIGGLNSYRTADANWRIGAAYADADVTVPTLFLYGAQDPSFGFFPDWEARLRTRVPGLRGIEPIAGAGHFVQQEQPEAFNAAMLGFLDEVMP